MSEKNEVIQNPTKEIKYYSPDGVSIRQISTRGNGVVQKGEKFNRDSIDFSATIDHMKIHIGDEIAGSQFNGELFILPEDVVVFIKSSLPKDLYFDQNGMAEVSLKFKDIKTGFSGVQSIEYLESLGVSAEKRMRMPGGELGEEDGIVGAWYPETVRDKETGGFVVATNPDGTIKNRHGKFEPEALIATVDDKTAKTAMSTDKISVIIMNNNGVPLVLTAYPGEIAPQFPAKIQSEDYLSDTLDDETMRKFWETHAFIQVK